MKSVYLNRFFQRVSSGTRTGLGVLIVGLLLQFVKGLKDLVVFSTFAPVMTICVCDTTVGKVLRNSITVGFVSLFNIGTAIIVYRFLRPPMHLGVSIACIGFFSFIVSYPSSVHLLSRKIGLAQVGILYIYPHVVPSMDIIMVPLKLLFSTTLGSVAGVVAVLLPWPRLGVWEVLQCAKSTAHSTSELMKAAVSAFGARDEGSFAAIRLHSKMLRTAALNSLAELKEKQAEIWWELKASCSKRSRFTNMTRGLSGLNQHLTGMEMALQSGYTLQCPDVMRKTLEQPLMKVADHCGRLLELATKSLTSCTSCTCASNLHAEERKSLMDEVKLALSVFDLALLEARKNAYYITTSDESTKREGVVEESATTIPEEEECHSLIRLSADIVSPVHRRFMARLTGNFFMFSLRLYFVEAMLLVDADFKIHTSMHEIAGARLLNWIPRRLSKFSALPLNPFFEDPGERAKSSIDLSGIEEDTHTPVSSSEGSLFHEAATTLPGEVSAPGGESSDVVNSPTVPTTQQPETQCSQCKSSLLASSQNPDPDLWKWLRSLVRALVVKSQVVKSAKVSMIMMLATVFGCHALPNDIHAAWAPITVSFIIGNLQGGAFRLASLRIQGTAVGSIFGYLVVSELYNHKYILPLILAAWVSFSDYIRYSKSHGYSGLVSALTAAILMCGDFDGQDIKEFAMDRIAMTFIGVACFVLVETVVLPERAVVLVREELLKSLKRLRDCVAAIVAVYTSQGCLKCRSSAVKDMQKLEQQLRAGLVAQTSLNNEAVLEPELWFVPFPGEVYSRVISIQNRMLDLLFFMVCCLQASTEDWSDEHMQKLLKPLRSSLTALEDEVLSTVHSLQKLLEKTRKSFWDWLPNLSHVLAAFRGIIPCAGDVEKVLTPASPPPPRVRRRLGSVVEVFQPSRRASRALLALGHRRRSIGGTPVRLKTTMERFEQTFESVLDELMAAHNKSVESVGGDGNVVSNSVMLSISSLSFCLHSLLKETVDLEKAVWELLQAENPQSILDFWKEFGPASQQYHQQSEEEPQLPQKRSSWS